MTGVQTCALPILVWRDLSLITVRGCNKLKVGALAATMGSMGKGKRLDVPLRLAGFGKGERKVGAARLAVEAFGYPR